MTVPMFQCPMFGALLQTPNGQLSATAVLKTLLLQMASNGYGAAVGTSDKCNLGQGSSRVLTDNQLDPLAQGQ